VLCKHFQRGVSVWVLHQKCYFEQQIQKVYAWWRSRISGYF